MLHNLIKAIEDTGKELGLIDGIQADRKVIIEQNCSSQKNAKR